MIFDYCFRTLLCLTVMHSACMHDSSIPWYLNTRNDSNREQEPDRRHRTYCINDDRKSKSKYTSKRKRKRLTVDSGASVHCINDKSLFEHTYDDHPPVNVYVANKQKLTAMAVGTVRIHLTSTKGKSTDYVLHNVVYHPDFSENLISVHRLWKDSRLSTHFAGTNKFVDALTGDSYKFDWANKGYHLEAHSARTALPPHILHSRFGHCSERRLNKLRERSLNFPNYPSDKRITHDPSDCDACQQGGMRRHPYGKRSRGRYTYFGEKLSSDLCKFPKSIEGYKYVLCIVDAYSNWLVTVPLRDKASAEVKAALESYLRTYKQYLPTDKDVYWHTDNGGEFMTNDLDNFCDEFCVKRSFAVPYNAPHNAHAERMWGLILRTTRILLAQSGVHESFWPYAVSQATLLHNYLPSSKLAGEISPFEALKGTPPDVSKIRTWGCIAWYYLPERDRTSKISPRAVPAIHLGYDVTRNAYYVFIPYLNRITTAHSITFQERRFMIFSDAGIASMPTNVKPLRDTEHKYKEDRDDKPRKKKKRDDTKPPDTKTPHPPKTVDNAPKPDQSIDKPDESDSSSSSSSSYSSAEELPPTRAEQTEKGKNPPRAGRDKPIERFNPDPQVSKLIKRNHRIRKQLVGETSNVTVMLDDVSEQLLTISSDALICDVTTPKTFEEATKSRFADRWWEAMKTEITSLLEHKTWTLVDSSQVPNHRKVTKSRWCYTIKLNRDGSIERFKARFVVCGYSQVKGEDYTHAFSATLRATSFRLLMAIAAGEKLKLEHFDVKNAFTQSEIDSEIYTLPPKGFETKGKDGLPQVLKLVKSLYGTKQASRLWQLKLRDTLVNKMGFSNSLADPCLYCKRDDKGGVMIIGVYVDDIILAHKGVDLNDFIKAFTGPDGFNAKHLGKLNWFLGMGIDQHEDYSVTVNQELYTRKLIERFCPNRKPSMGKRAAPLDPTSFQKLRAAQTDLEREKAARVPYLQIIGSLLYLSCMTRPDIAYYMSVLCSFMHDPTVEAYGAALDLLLYVAHTPHSPLSFTGVNTCPEGVPQSHASHVTRNHGLIAYSDASWHKPNKLGYNMFGYVVYLYGGPISFASKSLKVIALSSAEAEYAAAAFTCKELMFVRNLCDFLGVRLDGPTVMAVDNQAAIKIAENLGVTGRNKHFQDSLHYFRHLVDHRVVSPVYVTTKNQRADGFTKPLDNTTFKRWKLLLSNLLD